MIKEGVIVVTCAHEIVTLNLETKHSCALLSNVSPPLGRLDGAACEGDLFYFADSLNHRIYVCDLTSAEVSLIAVSFFLTTLGYRRARPPRWPCNSC